MDEAALTSVQDELAVTDLPARLGVADVSILVSTATASGEVHLLLRLHEGHLEVSPADESTPRTVTVGIDGAALGELAGLTGEPLEHSFAQLVLDGRVTLQGDLGLGRAVGDAVRALPSHLATQIGALSLG